MKSFREWGEGTLADLINSLRGLRPAAEITSHPMVHIFLIANLLLLPIMTYLSL